jgi:HlyD family secretion protein
LKIAHTIRTPFIAASIVLLAIWGASAFRFSDPPTAINVTPALHGDLLTAITATGSLEATRSVDVKYDGQEFVSQLLVKEGDHVRKGQMVARMDVQVLEHTRAQDSQTFEKDEASLSQAEAYYKRIKSLADEGIIALSELDVARANYQSLLHQCEADRQALMAVESQIARATLYSPVDGIVTELYVQRGEMLGSAAAVAAIGANSATSKPTNILMTIAQGGSLQVWADVNAADLGGVGKQQPVEISIDAFRPKVFRGIVKEIALQPTINNGVTTYQVKIDLRDRNSRFRIGMPTDVMLLRTIVKSGTLVPAEAIMTIQGKTFVRVAQKTNLETTERLSLTTVPVQVLGENGKAAAIEGNVRPGEFVVTSQLENTNGSFRAISVAFRPNPDFSDFQFSGQKSGLANAQVIPGPKPKGVLQSIFGL